jgi:hypothetical protein
MHVACTLDSDCAGGNFYAIVLSAAKGNCGSKKSRPPPKTSVADPLHFGVDPDPDPRIHASGSGWILQDASKKLIF